MADLEDLTPEMKAVIGRESAPVPHEVSALGIRTFARAVGYTNPVYYDIDAAKAKGHRDLLAPPGYYGMPVFRPDATTGGEADPGGERFSRRLNGGTEVEPLLDVHAGDVLDAVTRVTDLQLRPTRLGQMLVRVAETVYTRRSDGAVVGRIRNTGLRY